MGARSSLDVVEEELIAAGANYRLVKNKHVKVWVLADGREHLYVCSQNGQGRHRAIENSRAGIRRLLKQLGPLAPKPAPGINCPRSEKENHCERTTQRT